MQLSKVNIVSSEFFCFHLLGSPEHVDSFEKFNNIVQLSLYSQFFQASAIPKSSLNFATAHTVILPKDVSSVSS